MVGIVVKTLVVRDDETLHSQSFCDQQARYAEWSRTGFAVIHRNCATTRDSAFHLHCEQGGLQYVAAGIVEVNIHPIWCHCR